MIRPDGEIHVALGQGKWGLLGSGRWDCPEKQKSTQCLVCGIPN